MNDESCAWAQVGLNPVGAAEWRSRGFGPEEARKWTEDQCGPEEARGWVDLGVGPLEAGQWAVVGHFTAQEAREWRSRGIGAERAISWSRHHGFGAKEAWEWAQAGFGPPAAHWWRLHGFGPEAAREWRAVCNADEAREWVAIGVVPRKAQSLRRKDVYPPRLPVVEPPSIAAPPPDAHAEDPAGEHAIVWTTWRGIYRIKARYATAEAAQEVCDQWMRQMAARHPGEGLLWAYAVEADFKPRIVAEWVAAGFGAREAWWWHVAGVDVAEAVRRRAAGEAPPVDLAGALTDFPT